MTVCSCKESKQVDTTSSDTTDSIVQNDKKQQLTNIEVDETNSEECDFSNEFKDIIRLLKQDDYNIDTTLTEDTLKFQIRDRLEIVQSYEFYPKDFKFIFAKRKTRLKEMEDNWYPNFRVYEICFDNEQEAIDYESKLTEVLSSPDIFNDKNYDYLIRNHDRIIYVTCGAKIFEQYAFQYRDTIEKIIKN
ncbi:hypothetical protein ACFQ1M_11530 [Sungkyunkwania multivorans]|uniref:Uncharacterized protein n=1 Tax=Sungkyunkwania multivorans TaxID=1173618 RepID=A0ABW3D139_9FLAO